MGKKAWIAFSIIVVLTVAAALVVMLVLVPQIQTSGVGEETYTQVAKQEYTYSGKENTNKLKQDYTITADDVNYGLKTDKYEEGNINPFTPKGEVTIYNEPTKKPINNGSTTLSPSDK